MSPPDDRQARLVPTLLNVMVAGAADPQRLSRGRTYARQGAVTDIEIEPGLLSGQVQGNRAQPYLVTIRTAPAAAGSNPTELVPTRRDVTYDCTCPDWESPCKHAVAVMLSFAERAGRSPELLARWRGLDASAPASRAVVGSRTTRQPAGPVELPADARSALRAFLGEPAPSPERPSPPRLARLPRSGADSAEPWLTMLHSALDELERRPRRR